jgi:hypothetical protein
MLARQKPANDYHDRALGVEGGGRRQLLWALSYSPQPSTATHSRPLHPGEPGTAPN